jgi:MFS family permease
MIWGLLPILLSRLHFSLTDIGILTAAYPAVWGLSQLLTGKMADVFSKKRLLFWGMLLQAVAIFVLAGATDFWFLFIVCFFLGIGTAMVYPTFLAAISEYTHPYDRAKSLGVFRFWRDSGYAIGAVLTGLSADLWGVDNAILLTAAITLFSSLIILFRMK